MTLQQKLYFEKRGKILVKNLKKRHFDAYYCATKEEALATALSLIPQCASVGWGGALSAQQIGLMDAVKAGNYRALDRADAVSKEDESRIMRESMFCDVFLTGANSISLDGEMVNIDGKGNRVSAIICGPESVIVVAGMNKVQDTLDSAIARARTIAAPMNQQRFMLDVPCSATGVCADCKAEACICNHIVITRHCRPVGRIKFVLVGEELGF